MSRLWRFFFSVVLLLFALQPANTATAQALSNALLIPNAVNAANEWSIQFSGSAPAGKVQNSYVSVPYSADLNPSGGAITIEAWVKRTSADRCETVVGNNYHSSYWLGFCNGAANSAIKFIRPDGIMVREELLTGHVVGAVSISTDRQAYAATDTGDIYAMGLNCPPNSCRAHSGPGTAYNTPPLLLGGSVFAGKTNSTLERRSDINLALQASFSADSPITAGPIAAPNGDVFIGTQNGMLYILNAADLTVRWQRYATTAVQGGPAFSSDTLYIVSGSILTAYNPTTGSVRWSVALPDAGSGSTAIGCNRQLYVQSSSGSVYGLGNHWVSPVWNVSQSAAIAGSGLMANKTYYYQVVALNDTGESKPSAYLPGHTRAHGR